MKDRLITAAIILSLLAFAGLIIYLHVSTTRSWLLEQRLQKEGIETAVTILALERHNSVRGPSYCEATFSYTVDTADYVQTTKVSPDFCSIFSQGSQAEAHYLAEAPDIADLTWGGYNATQLFIMLLCDGTTILAAIAAAIAYKLNQRTSRRNSTLLSQQPGAPLIIIPPRGSQLTDIGCLLPFGLLVSVLIGGFMLYAIFNWRNLDPGLPIVLLISGAPFFAFGLLIIYLALQDFIHSFTFTADQIQVRYFLFTQRHYAASTLQDVKIVKRPLRSQRQIFALVLHFQDGKTIDVQRSNLGHSDDQPPPELTQLQTHLRQLYF